MIPLRVARLFANSDPALFRQTLAEAGLAVVGRRNTNPLSKNVQPSSIMAMASTMTEDVNDHTELTAYQRALKTLAEGHGYVVALSEGLNQMPGTLPTPIRSLLRAEPEPPPEDGGGEEGGEEDDGNDVTVNAGGGAPPPPGGGGAPPPPGGGAPPAMPPAGPPPGGLPVV